MTERPTLEEIFEMCREHLEARGRQTCESVVIYWRDVVFTHWGEAGVRRFNLWVRGQPFTGRT